MPKKFSLTPADEKKLKALETDAAALIPMQADGSPVRHDGGLWKHVTDLYIAIKARDMMAIWTAARDLVDHFLGEENPPVFAAGFDWAKFRDFITKVLQVILPLILI